MELSERIKYSRSRLAISQREFAKRLDTTQKVVFRWESGAKPRKRALERISEIAGVRLAWLANGEGGPVDESSLSRDEERMVQHLRGIQEGRSRYEALARVRFASDYIKAKSSIELAVEVDFMKSSEETRRAILADLMVSLESSFGRLCSAYADFRVIRRKAREVKRNRDVADPFHKNYRSIQKEIEGMRGADKEWIFEKLEEIADDYATRSSMLRDIVNQE